MEFSASHLYEIQKKTFPFSQKLPFGVKSAEYTLNIKGSVTASPTEFEINIRDADNRDKIHFRVHQRWNEEGETVYYDRNMGQSSQCWPEYALFTSLKPGSLLDITIASVQEDPVKSVFLFEVEVNDDVVCMFQYKKTSLTEEAELEIKCPNNDISVCVIQMDYTRPH